ncbi:hypothetical protein [Bacteroides oleiciplenus]|nr:hypothetical protein [Bacteroides oleiciplenus]
MLKPTSPINSVERGRRGFVLTGALETSYFDDVYELLPYEQEEVD